MMKNIRKKKGDKKGFTLVELIVVLVILAILAAILVPALLGYIEKAREKQITTNANAAYVAAQSILNEQYSLNKASEVKQDSIISLTDLTTDKASWKASYKTSTSTASTSQKSNYKITAFSYEENGKTVYLNSKTGAWEKESTAAGVVTPDKQIN